MGKGKLKKALKKVGKVGAAVATGGLSLAASKKTRAKVKAKVSKAKNKGAFKKIGKIGAAIATGGVSLLADKKVQGKLKKAGGKAKTALKKAAAKANPIKVLKKIANGAKEGVEFATLLPFLPPMLIALKAKHVKVPHPAKVKEVAGLFYSNVIQNQHLEHCEHLDNYRSGEVALGIAKNLYKQNRHHIIADAAAGVSKGIISAILDFFTAKRKQKEADEKLKNGEPLDESDELTEEEKAVVGDNNELTVGDVAMVAAVDKSTDALVNEVGGTDSEGNEVEPPDESESGVNENVTGKKTNPVKKQAEPSKSSTVTDKKTAVIQEDEDKKPTYGFLKFFHHNRN